MAREWHWVVYVYLRRMCVRVLVWMCVCVCVCVSLQPLQMVEYLVGDGPNNRYALICSQCRSHNGMALRDEFEYLAFRCAYCYHLNPARKKKPSLRPQTSATTLPQQPPPTSNGEQASNSQVRDWTVCVTYIYLYMLWVSLACSVPTQLACSGIYMCSWPSFC